MGQGEGSLSPSADLEKRVAALATTGEEEVSFSQVERRLLDWRNRRKVNVKVGLIPQLEGELRETQETISRQGALLEQIQTLTSEKEALEVQKAGLESRLQAHDNARSAQMSQRWAQAQADYDEALEKVESLRKTAGRLPPAEELRQAQGDLSYLRTLNAQLKQADKALPRAKEKAETARKAVKEDPYFGGLEPTQATAQAQKDHGEGEDLAKKRPTRYFCFLFRRQSPSVLPYICTSLTIPVLGAF